MRSAVIGSRSALSHVTREELRALHRRKPERQIRTLWLVTIWVLAAIVIETNYHELLTFFATILIAFVLGAAPVLMHEAVHGNIVRSRSANYLVGLLSGAVALLSVTAYRDYHLYHHANYRDTDDQLRIAGFDLTSPIVAIATLLVGSYVFLILLPFVGWKRCKKPKRMLAEYTGIILCAAAAVTFEPQLAVSVWLLPLSISLLLTNIRGLAEHAWTQTGGEFTSVRTVISNKALSYFILNINYHLEHHLYPGIPWYNLPEAHKLIKPIATSHNAEFETGYLSFGVKAIHRALRFAARQPEQSLNARRLQDIPDLGQQ
jgi:fatty acid desaturase